MLQPRDETLKEDAFRPSPERRHTLVSHAEPDIRDPCWALSAFTPPDAPLTDVIADTKWKTLGFN